MEENIVVDSPEQMLKIFEALSSRAKIRILRVVIEKNGASAKEIAEELGLKIPTVLEHLRKLVEAGILTVSEEVRDGRKLKVYRPRARRFLIELDIQRLVESEKIELENLLKRYLSLRFYGYRIKMNPTVYEVRRVLGIDEELAKTFVSYLRSRMDYIVETLIKDLIDRGLDEVTIPQMIEVLNIDHSLAALVAMKMVEKGFAVAEKGRIRIVKKSSS